MNNVLSKKITFLSILKFTAPTIVMMVFMSLYTMVDGIFVSNFVGTDALSAVNIVYPIFNVVIAVSIMLATGGSAVIAIKMGEGRNKEANEIFSFIVLVGVVVGVLFIIIGLIFIKPIITALGAEGNIYKYCYSYGFLIIIFTPFAILQLLFQYFFVTAGKPNIGLGITVLGGLANIALDYVFIVLLEMGIAGAALATGIGFCIPAIYGLIYFFHHKKGSLYFVKPKFDWQILLDSCINGSSEMVTNLSTAITTFMFNTIMLKTLGGDGVAAITIVLYAQFLLTAVYLGYSSGVAPLISYNYGNSSTEQLRKIFKISMIFIITSSIGVFIFSNIFSDLLITVFAKRDSNVFSIAENGFFLFSFSYIFIGVNIFASALFTAFSNGKISAIISFLRTLVFIILATILLVKILGINGLWLAIPFAETLTFTISLWFIYKYRGIYNYI